MLLQRVQQRSAAGLEGDLEMPAWIFKQANQNFGGFVGSSSEGVGKKLSEDKWCVGCSRADRWGAHGHSRARRSTEGCFYSCCWPAENNMNHLGLQWHSRAAAEFRESQSSLDSWHGVMNPCVTFRAVFRAEHPHYSGVPLTVGQLFAVLTSGCHKMWQESREPWKSPGPEINFQPTRLKWCLEQTYHYNFLCVLG